jgi:hypothetical protein
MESDLEVDGEGKKQGLSKGEKCGLWPPRCSLLVSNGRAAMVGSAVALPVWGL